MNLFKIATAILAKRSLYEYKYDPEHKDAPTGSGWSKTEAGWSKGKDDSQKEETNKIVDSNGNPKIMYRGLSQNYNSDKNPPIIWFTEDKSLAQEYSNGEEIISGNLFCKKPLPFARSEKQSNTNDCYQELSSLIEENFTNETISREQGIDLIKSLDRLRTDNKDIKLYQLWDDYPEVKTALQTMGYDGLISQENGSQTVGIFNEKQFNKPIPVNKEQVNKPIVVNKEHVSKRNEELTQYRKQKFEGKYSSKTVENAETELQNLLLRRLSSSNVYIRIPIKSLNKVIEDKRFKSQFETNRSNGIFNTQLRMDIEKDLFGYEDNLQTEKRPIYGYWGLDENDFGMDAYGKASVKLKDKKIKDASFCFDDSFDFNKETAVACSMFGKTSPLNISTTYVSGFLHNHDLKTYYIEAQVHNGVSVDDIEQVVFCETPEKELLDKLDKLKIKYEVKKRSANMVELIDARIDYDKPMEDVINQIQKRMNG